MRKGDVNYKVLWLPADVKASGDSGGNEIISHFFITVNVPLTLWVHSRYTSILVVPPYVSVSEFLLH